CSASGLLIIGSNVQKYPQVESYGMIRAYLENKGIPIEHFDTQIAAQYLARKLTALTNLQIIK
ncbi:MAG: hypothetical protein ACTTIT_06500, partial [Treponema sp.]